MTTETIALLRCPFCGTSLSLVNNEALRKNGLFIETGVLGCECCAFPIVDGIPVLISNDRIREALRTLEAGHPNDARQLLLNLDQIRANALTNLIAAKHRPTYRELLSVLSVDAESDYFLYRFSDPTYLSAEAVLSVITADERRSGPTLDLCGGSGHLTRALMLRPPHGDTVLADLFFWKLWLAARVTARGCVPICCDANNPLPFLTDHFSTVVLSDAFPYVWHKKLCATEMMRVSKRDAVIALPHLHSALGENVSAGDPLTPAAYENLFEPHAPRLFDDQCLIDDLLEEKIVDLTQNLTPAGLGETPSCTLIASTDPLLFSRYRVEGSKRTQDTLAVNPLYRIDYKDGCTQLTLEFPTPEYEDEYSATKRYLPARVTVEADLRGPITTKLIGDQFRELRNNHVLLDVPRHYC